MNIAISLFKAYKYDGLAHTHEIVLVLVVFVAELIRSNQSANFRIISSAIRHNIFLTSTEAEGTCQTLD